MTGRREPRATPQQHQAAYDDADSDGPGQRHDVAVAAGTDSLLAGDRSTARTWFQRATRHALERGDELVENGEAGPEAAAAYVDALVAAALSGEENLATDAATRVYANADALEAVSPPAAFLESQVLATTMLDDQDVHPLAALLRDREGDPSTSALPPGDAEHLVTACKGLVERDADAVERGLSGLLDAHAARAEEDDAVCHPVAALLALARRRRLNVTLDDPAVPDALTDGVEP